ncbi:hypothetical protein AALP_AA2G026000 [Arabis alpina]|uniref:Uncharacterized protein n=1 Tax=Arabis alpina TaxID=50452 RepID=A0A087HEW2_ARAAL|nr:hypothetical protein AALP_AA2G026000 [Arabis alpina]
MIFSKLGRSISRSRGLLYGGGVRSARLLAPPAFEVSEVESGLGFLRRHFASLSARKGLVNNDLTGVFANPRILRFFSDEAPKKKNYENYFPKDAKQTQSDKFCLSLWELDFWTKHERVRLHDWKGTAKSFSRHDTCQGCLSLSFYFHLFQTVFYNVIENNSERQLWHVSWCENDFAVHVNDQIFPVK